MHRQFETRTKSAQPGEPATQRFTIMTLPTQGVASAKAMIRKC
jgi:hypothetical protein